jgi:hypothetical protein
MMIRVHKEDPITVVEYPEANFAQPVGERWVLIGQETATTSAITKETTMQRRLMWLLPAENVGAVEYVNDQEPVVVDGRPSGPTLLAKA